MKQLARRFVHWTNIDADIERLIKSCCECVAVKLNPPKAKIHPWAPPLENWKRVHTDHAGPFQGYYFLVVVDTKSKWAEIRLLNMLLPPWTPLHY